MRLDPDDRPRLRDLEPVAVMVNGKRVIGLKDPLQLREGMVCVQQEALQILALLDGERSLRDIQAELTRQTGRLVFIDELSDLLNFLEEACLLEGERACEAYRTKVAQYRELPFRPFRHAGISYSAQSEVLRKELATYFTEDGGPGALSHCSEDRRPVGLIAPHIDIRAGSRCFAQAYHALAAGQPSDVYVILGTGHAGVKGMFCATSHNFDTPLGMIETDREFVEALSRDLGRDACAEEILHETEHVIEFQAIFLQYVLGGRRPFRVVPVLCSLPHQMFSDDDRFASYRQSFEEFCSAVRNVCSKRSQSVCFIASADLDHIGPRYGDRFVPRRETVSEAIGTDLKMLSLVEKLDFEGFVAHVGRENDEKRICGFSPIATLLRCMDADQGRLLGLEFAQVDDRNSFVTFAAMIFYGNRSPGHP